jgi:hypothetical protein
MALRWCGLVLVFLARASLASSGFKPDHLAKALRAAIAAFISSGLEFFKNGLIADA